MQRAFTPSVISHHTDLHDLHEENSGFEIQRAASAYDDEFVIHFEIISFAARYLRLLKDRA
jgi:hypothetical protein